VGPRLFEAQPRFRPGRRAHDAIVEAQRYIQAGRKWVVDVDLEKFFDRVNHDVLMGRLAKRVDDARCLRLIRRYLEAGILANGVAMERSEGTPQGGPLSPLLANLRPLRRLRRSLTALRAATGSIRPTIWVRGGAASWHLTSDHCGGVRKRRLDPAHARLWLGRAPDQLS
jgi:retron-type reverse transcriptase